MLSADNPKALYLGDEVLHTQYDPYMLRAKSDDMDESMIMLSVRRYRKGLELIRWLYEKALSLEYHFSSLQLNERVDALANPMNFKAFRKSLAELENLTGEREKMLELPEVLLQNSDSGTLYLLMMAMQGKGKQKERQQVLDEVACLLRFLMEMQTDLKSVYYENHLLYLRTTELRQRCERLFEDYTKVVGYQHSLPECRTRDDWDTIEELIKAVAKIILEGELEENSDLRDVAYQHHINLEFAVDRLLDYLNFYDAVLNDGRHMYRESELVLQHLTKVENCTSSVPEELLELGEDISIAVERFDKAYETVELKGSRLKDLLYGYDYEKIE